MAESNISRELEDLKLSEATVQEIMLELIRRRRLIEFDGPAILQLLLEHRHLWAAVIFDHLGTWTNDAPPFPILSLIKLRDLPHNEWNVDTIYALCRTEESAEELARIFNENALGGMAQVHAPSQALSNAFGADGEGYVVTIWWD